jgi:hypothetical protein
VSRATSTSYRARQDTTPENEIAVLATIYKIALDSANGNAVAITSTDGNDAERDLSDSATPNYTE